MIAIVDYGAGNLQSVRRAFDYIGVKSGIVALVEELNNIERLVLPGVGAFGAAMEGLKASGFYEAIREWLKSDRPFLGICLGMQLLFEGSSESEGVEGFAVFKGKCLRFNEGKVPQIGWNQIRVEKDSKLLEGINNNAFFYFLHGYCVEPEDTSIVTATTQYGVAYPSVVERGNIFATQFHPEKSGKVGLKMLKNWVELC